MSNRQTILDEHTRLPLVVTLPRTVHGGKPWEPEALAHLSTAAMQVQGAREDNFANGQIKWLWIWNRVCAIFAGQVVHADVVESALLAHGPATNGVNYLILALRYLTVMADGALPRLVFYSTALRTRASGILSKHAEAVDLVTGYAMPPLSAEFFRLDYLRYPECIRPGAFSQRLMLCACGPCSADPSRKPSEKNKIAYDALVYKTYLCARHGHSGDPEPKATSLLLGLFHVPIFWLAYACNPKMMLESVLRYRTGLHRDRVHPMRQIERVFGVGESYIHAPRLPPKTRRPYNITTVVFLSFMANDYFEWDKTENSLVFPRGIQELIGTPKGLDEVVLMSRGTLDRDTLGLRGTFGSGDFRYNQVKVFQAIKRAYLSEAGATQDLLAAFMATIPPGSGPGFGKRCSVAIPFPPTGLRCPTTASHLADHHYHREKQPVRYAEHLIPPHVITPEQDELILSIVHHKSVPCLLPMGRGDIVQLFAGLPYSSGSEKYDPMDPRSTVVGALDDLFFHEGSCPRSRRSGYTEADPPRWEPVPPEALRESFFRNTVQIGNNALPPGLVFSDYHVSPVSPNGEPIAFFTSRNHASRIYASATRPLHVFEDDDDQKGSFEEKVASGNYRFSAFSLMNMELKELGWNDEEHPLLKNPGGFNWVGEP